MKNVEIFKECEDGKLTMEEVDLILMRTDKSFRFNNDRANGYIAFALGNCNRRDANHLVDELNDYCVMNEMKPNWFLGDKHEEYVFLD